METAIWDARSGRDTLALLFVDLNGFKTVNDRFGHAAGDELLQSVARTLRSRLRRGDLLARLGGDEFLVALLGLDPATAADEARRVADELADAVRRPWSARPGRVGRGERRGRRLPRGRRGVRDAPAQRRPEHVRPQAANSHRPAGRARR